MNRYSWPGNVRELEHVINRAALKAKARLFDKKVVTVSIDDCGHFDDESRITPTKQSKTSAPVIDHSKGIRESTEEYQRSLISNALIECEYNWAKASRVLKTDRANLIRLSKRLGISVTKSHTLSRS